MADKGNGAVSGQKDLADWKLSPDWADWHWQLAHRITRPEEAARLLGLPEGALAGAAQAAETYPMAVTPYYLSLIDAKDANCPIRRMAIPDPAELNVTTDDIEDPSQEDSYSPLPAIIHRYPDRLLITGSLECATYCRHCFRKRKVGGKRENVSLADIRAGIAYIRENEAIRDVLISGGDPLMLNDDIIEDIVRELREIPHVELIRIGTRTPVTMPQRISDELLDRLKKYHPVWVNTHFNHPREFSPESERALARLADAGFPLGNQSVLLKGINDNVDTMRELIQLLVKNRVRPYYLYHCDYLPGLRHFRTPLSRGIELLEQLIGFTTGFAIPTYVIDAPGGGGKIPLAPDYFVKNAKDEIILKNFEGTHYPVHVTE
ncbi:MAG: KamA family radical SAM protein [Syntrophomonadaceae bacterium]|nr:KamA family radical SAM protein [Syntrophomonadaceae bacterium]